MSSLSATISNEKRSSGCSHENQPSRFTEYSDANICSAASILISFSRGKRTISVTKSNAYFSRPRYFSHWKTMYVKKATKNKKPTTKMSDSKNVKIWAVIRLMSGICRHLRSVYRFPTEHAHNFATKLHQPTQTKVRILFFARFFFFDSDRQDYRRLLYVLLLVGRGHRFFSNDNFVWQLVFVVFNFF